MTFQSCLSALLGLAILSLCNIALVNAGDENTVYAIHANLCTYQKRTRWQIHDKVEMVKAPAKVIGVPVGMTCALHYDPNTTHQWACNSTPEMTRPAKGTAITILQGIKDPDSGKAFKKVGRKSKKEADAYIVADTVAGSRLVWSNTGYAVISQPDNTQSFLCIQKGSRHPRVFGVTLKLRASVGTRTKGRLGKGTFVTETDSYPLELQVPNKPSAMYPPIYELKYEGEAGSGQWKIGNYLGDIYASLVVGRGIAIKAVKDKKTKDAVTFSLVKASSWPPKHEGKSTVAYLIPAPTCRAIFQHGKAKFYEKEKVDPTNAKRQVRPSINIKLEKRIVVQKPEHPLPLKVLNALAKFAIEDIEIAPSHFNLPTQAAMKEQRLDDKIDQLEQQQRALAAQRESIHDDDAQQEMDAAQTGGIVPSAPQGELVLIGEHGEDKTAYDEIDGQIV